MTCNELDMARGTYLRFDDEPGTSIHVWSGALWITQEGDARDHYLTAGQSFTIDRTGTTLATAMHRACISVTPVSRERRSLGFLPLFLTRETG